ncbi:MAG: hypothetical protein AAF989_09425 [Planctomycetota bacterium]
MPKTAATENRVDRGADVFYSNDRRRDHIHRVQSMRRILAVFTVLCLVSGVSIAANWNAEDDTFDPGIHSVVIGDRSWLGDPSPFVHSGVQRTGYTHVQKTEWEGFEPSVQLSLIVPSKPGEKMTQVGGMLLLNEDQATKFLDVVESWFKSDSDSEKRIPIETGMKNAHWEFKFLTDKGQRFLQLESKNKEKVDRYRFGVNPSKKLVGAIRHSLSLIQAKGQK